VSFGLTTLATWRRCRTMSDADLDRLQDRFQRLADRVRLEGGARRAHSVEGEGTSSGRSSAA
jgi:hypothetical protein